MRAETIIQERITFDSGNLRLSGVLTYPQSEEPICTILLCSPHPHFAGNMDNNVIRELATHLAHNAITLRFDYRGIGDSQIDLPKGQSVFDYWDAIEENKDYNDAVCDVKSASGTFSRIVQGLPQILIGYSFGAATAFMSGLQNDLVQQIIGISPPFTKVDFSFLAECQKPAFVVLGKEDFLYTSDDVEVFRGMASSAVEFKLLDGCDHFFRGQEKIVVETVFDFINNNI